MERKEDGEYEAREMGNEFFFMMMCENGQIEMTRCNLLKFPENGACIEPITVGEEADDSRAEDDR